MGRGYFEAMSENKHHETPALKSKKFWAFMVSNFFWKVLCLCVALTNSGLGSNGVLLAIVIVSGFLDVTYIGGQTALDHYVRTASILAGKKRKESDEDPIAIDIDTDDFAEELPNFYEEDDA